MFKIIKGNKIVSVSNSDVVIGLDYDVIKKDTEHSVEDYAEYNGEFLLKSDIPTPTKEKQKKRRAQAYLLEIDPITAHIQRLRDDAQTTGDLSKIKELMLERDAKVEEIKARYPYPEDVEPIIASGD